MSNEKGSVLPRRLPLGPKATDVKGNETDVSQTEQQKKIIESAPLSTGTSQPSQVEEKPAQEDKYPWRKSTTMSEDELMFLKQKKSYDVVMELLLRMEYIKNHKKPRAFGQKITETSMLHDALDKWTRDELKALGYSVK
ncbi:hypothetical protein [Acinetobacter colistiniresistens]|uniref:hypothetical protein n=1 Tax=Acinetobacter colistiniresistens TaxID=280145 RepID=UPI0012504A49|nr:hypothetical protein [Acinetobacter colistiniresistens]